MATSSTSEASSSYNRKTRSSPRRTSAADKQVKAERSQRRTNREERLASREKRTESRERRQRLTRPASKVKEASTKGTGSSTALGLGILGTAALFIAAGIQNKKLAQILEPGHEVGSTTLAGIETTPATEALSSEGETKTEQTAPNPFTIGPNLKTYFALGKELREAHTYKDQLLQQVAQGKLSQKESSKRFSEKYPHYLLWAKELREMEEVLKREHVIK